jgi:hypothetical protein
LTAFNSVGSANSSWPIAELVLRLQTRANQLQNSSCVCKPPRRVYFIARPRSTAFILHLQHSASCVFKTPHPPPTPVIVLRPHLQHSLSSTSSTRTDLSQHSPSSVHTNGLTSETTTVDVSTCLCNATDDRLLLHISLKSLLRQHHRWQPASTSPVSGPAPATPSITLPQQHSYLRSSSYTTTFPISVHLQTSPLRSSSWNNTVSVPLQTRYLRSSSCNTIGQRVSTELYPACGPVLSTPPLTVRVDNKTQPNCFPNTTFDHTQSPALWLL